MSDFHSSPDADYPVKRSRTRETVDVSSQSPAITPPASNIEEKTHTDMLSSMAAMVRSSDSSSWLKATKWFNEFLSHEGPPIKEVMQSGVINKFVLFLTMEEDSPELQELAGQILIHIASGISMETDVFSEVIDPRQRALVLLLHSDDEETLRHTCASFAVLSGCIKVSLKQLILKTNLYVRVCQLVSHESPTVVIGALRTLGNLVKESEEVVKHMLSDGGFEELRKLFDHKYVCIQKEACWVTCYLCARGGWVIKEVFNSRLMKCVVNMLKNADIATRKVAAQAVSNATIGATNEQIQYLVSLGSIRALCLQLCCMDRRILNAALNGLEMIMKCGEKLKKDEDDFNQYAVDMYKCGGWRLLSDFYASYDYENYRKALLLQKRYSVLPEDEDEK